MPNRPSVQGVRQYAVGSQIVQVGQAGGSVTVSFNDGGRPRLLPLSTAHPPTLAGMEPSPAMLVHPLHSPVQLVGRDQELAGLVAWALDALIGNRPLTWVYREISLAGHDDNDGVRQVPVRSTCPICSVQP